MEVKRPQSFKQKMLAAQKKLPRTLPREGQAKMGSYSYKYTKLDTALEKIVPILNSVGLFLYETINQSEGNQHLSITIEDTDSDESITSTVLLPQAERMQDWGASISYSRRYALMPLLGLTGEDDTDASPDALAAKPGGMNRRATPAQLTALRNMTVGFSKGNVKKEDVDRAIMEMAGIENLNDLTAQSASNLMNEISTTKKVPLDFDEEIPEPKEKEQS